MQDQLGHLVNARPHNVGNEPVARTKGELDKPVSDICGVNGLEPPAGGNRYHWQLGHLLQKLQHRLLGLWRPVLSTVAPASEAAGVESKVSSR
jgi:hypothetical protein